MAGEYACEAGYDQTGERKSSNGARHGRLPVLWCPHCEPRAALQYTMVSTYVPPSLRDRAGGPPHYRVNYVMAWVRLATSRGPR